MPKTSKKKSTSPTHSEKSTFPPDNDPIQSLWLPPPEGLGVKLLNAVEYKPLEEKDLLGLKISKRALKHLSPAEIRDLCEVFRTFDRSQTGILKAKELFYALKVLGFSITEKICQEYVEFESIDLENKGINVNQFLDLIIDKQGNAKDNYDEIITSFNLFDYDKSGVISIENLRTACFEADVNLTETELKEMIQEADQNGDGFVDLNEFIAIILRTNLY